MEVALMGRQPTVACRPALFPVQSLRSSTGLDLVRAVLSWKKRPVRVALRAVRSEMAVEEKKKNESPPAGKPTGPVRLFVGLPLDAVTDCRTLNHVRAIAAGLRALKLLGVDGVDLAVYWGVVQPESGSESDWTAYLALARMVRDAGLRLRVSLRVDGSRAHYPLPKWVARAAESDPDLLFADRSGRRHKDCFSFAAEEIAVLDGKTPVEAYEGFFRSFVDAFSDLLGTTVTDVSVGLGPNGELRYPSFPAGTDGSEFKGVGEFQCYDKYMLAKLKKHAESSGKPLWGLGGPHDAPEYNQSPDGTFFKEHGGSWETPYGNFFLSWYSGQLLAHGDRLLSLASNVFGELPLSLSAKVPLVHWWHNSRSRPAELTAGMHGYDRIAEMFARNSCTMIVGGMDLADKDQPQGLRASPESLLSEIMAACERHGVRVSGENSSIGKGGLSKIKEKLSAENLLVESFTYQRMGADFFSPEHWPQFTEFVRSLVLPELDSDDLVSDDGQRVSLSVGAKSGKDRELQPV